MIRKRKNYLDGCIHDDGAQKPSLHTADSAEEVLEV
jgi:hypothetical protein